MTLPTPPGTGHRNKENRRPAVSDAQHGRVVWSQDNTYHQITASPPRALSVAASATKLPPTRSILKRPSLDADFVAPEAPREATPEPLDPLADLEYLAKPVAMITDDSIPLRDIVEGYSVLTARLRSTVPEGTDADASWPLFQPLRKHRAALVTAFSRDLGKALVDPHEQSQEAGIEKRRFSLLPSPKASPPKKRHGLSEEQVKYARDLCTVSQAVLKFLTLIFTLPAIFRVFSDDDLRSILTDALAIPLAPSLPTPNARKTYSLAVWLLQSQRLPEEVLFPARDRIACALQRGIEGELGKEGKKGSASDGLKAVHDLALHQPSTFVPAFVPLLGSILSNLLAPTLTLRTQAAHALGGLVLALASIPSSHTHSAVSAQVAAFLTTPSSPRKTSPTSQPGSPSKDPLIVRTLRTTMQASEPAHPAQGPVWACCVLARLVVLLGSRVYTEPKLARTVAALLAVGMQHRKSSVRALVCLVWRCITWVYFQPLLPIEVDEDEDEDADRDIVEVIQPADLVKKREGFWIVVKSTVDMGAGVSTIAALLCDDADCQTASNALNRVLIVLRAMVKKGGVTTGEAMETLHQLLGMYTSSLRDNGLQSTVPAPPWKWDKLLPRPLFEAAPGFLTVDYKSLATVVRPALSRTAGVEDVRWLKRDEIAAGFEVMVSVWREGVSSISCADANFATELPMEVVRMWEALLTAQGEHFVEDEDDLKFIAGRVSEVLVEFIQNPTFCVPSDAPDSIPGLGASTMDPTTVLVNKLSLIRALWNAARRALPSSQLSGAAASILEALISTRGGVETNDRAIEVWAGFCADVLIICENEEVGEYAASLSDEDDAWGWQLDARIEVWKEVAINWKCERVVSPETASVFLRAPFQSKSGHIWEMTAPVTDAWNGLLTHALTLAADYGQDPSTLLNNIASALPCITSPGTTLAVPAELLLTQLEMCDARESPTDLLAYVNTALLAAYPPHTDNRLPAVWLLRAITRAVDACPAVLLEELLESIHEGLAVWLADDCSGLSHQEYDFDLAPLYQTLLLSIQGLSTASEVAEKFTELLESPFSAGVDKPTSVMEAFLALKKQVVNDESPDELVQRLESRLSAEGDQDAQEVERLVEPVDSPEVIPPITPTDPHASPLLPSPTLFWDAQPTTIPATPSTPRPSTAPSTPPRPCRSTSASDRAIRLLAAPRSPSSPLKMSPTRTPRDLRYLDKENASPATVMERMAASSVKLGKRRELFEDYSPDRTPKRSRMQGGNALAPSPKIVASPRGAIKRDSITASPLTGLFSSMQNKSDALNGLDDQGVEEGTPSKPARKRTFMEAVEISPPALLRRPKRATRAVNQSPRRYGRAIGVRLTRLSVAMAKEVDPIPMPPADKKRKTGKASATDLFNYSPNLSPTKRILETVAFGSDDSILDIQEDDKSAQLPSSDDGPHGEILAHHVFSPALRKLGIFGKASSSDDAESPTSPSQAYAERRFGRSKSSSLPKLVPLSR